MVYRITARNNRSGKVWAHEVEQDSALVAITRHEASCPGWKVLKCEEVGKAMPAMRGWEVPDYEAAPPPSHHVECRAGIGSYGRVPDDEHRTLNRSAIAATLAELGWHELADDVRRGVPIKSIEAKVAKRGEPGSSLGLAGEGEALAAAIEEGTL